MIWETTVHMQKLLGEDGQYIWEAHFPSEWQYVGAVAQAATPAEALRVLADLLDAGKTMIDRPH